MQNKLSFQDPQSLPPIPAAMSVFFVGLGAGELSLVVLRWLSLTGMPTVLFLLLLLVGMPVGAVLLIRIRRLHDADFPMIIAISTWLALICVPLLLGVIAKSPPMISLDELVRAAQDEQARPPLILLILPLVATLALFPLFLGYGMVEFAAYRAGLKALRGNSGLVYALNLAGLIVAFVAHRLFLKDLATLGLFLVGIVSLVIPLLLLPPRRWRAAVVLLLVASLLLLPGLESALICRLRFNMPDSLGYWQPRCDKVLYDRWTPHCRLSLVEKGPAVFGFYSGLYYWAYFRGFRGADTTPGGTNRVDMAFKRLVRPGDNVAVIGAGGGVHVAAALDAGASKVVAVDVVPELLELISGPLKDHFEGVYSDPRVQLVAKNGRRFIGETKELFDVILLARLCSHITGLREFLEPSQLMFTRESFQSLGSRLKPGGVLMLTDNLGLDRHGVTFGQNFLELHQQGYKVLGYLDKEPWKDLRAAFEGKDEPMPRGAYVLVAQKNVGQRDASGIVEEYLRGGSARRFDQPPPTTARLGVTDDRAFATGLLIATIGLQALMGACGLIAVILIIAGGGLIVLLRRTGLDSGGVCPLRTSIAAAVVGFNFMSLEYLMVYRWMYHLDITVEATFVGMVVFVGLAALGGALAAKLPARSLLALNAAAAAVLLATFGMGPLPTLLAILPASFMCGSLFPRLLRGDDLRLVSVYAWDAYGTMWGGLAALIVPLFLGFSSHQIVCAISLIIAAVLVQQSQQDRTQDVPVGA